MENYMKIVTQHFNIGKGQCKVLIKDTIDIAATPTRAGSAALGNTPPALAHARVVEEILKYDCQIIGKANLHELAFGVTGINHFYGTPTNPKYPQLIPGGSSSGCAAGVAAQLADFAIGTDTGGSIRMPAACCGIYGLKPSFGRVSRQGVMPARSSLDCVGPLAGSLVQLTQAMATIDPSFALAEAQQQLTTAPKIARLEVSAAAEIWQCITDFLADAQCQATTVSLHCFEAAYAAGMQVINYENWQALGHLTQTGLLGDDVQQRLLQAAKTTAEQYAAALETKAQFTAELAALFEHYDVLLLPTLPQFPPKLEDAENLMAQLNLTACVRPFNLSGHPAISIPLETETGLPVGLQLVAKWGADEYLCAAASYLLAAATARSI
jgi:amidase